MFGVIAAVFLLNKSTDSASWLEMQYGDQRAVILHTRNGVAKKPLYSFSNWVEAWHGFAVVDNDGNLCSLQLNGGIKIKRPMAVYLDCFQWAVSPKGDKMALISQDRKHIDVVSVASGKVLASINSPQTNSGFDKLPFYGMCWSEDGKQLAFTAPTPGTKDSGGLFRPMTVIFTQANRKHSLVKGVVPISFNKSGDLYSWATEKGADDKTIRLITQKGKILSSLKGVLSANVASKFVMILREASKDSIVCESWSLDLRRCLARRELKGRSRSDIVENISVSSG